MSTGDYRFLFKNKELIWFSVNTTDKLYELWGDIVLEYGTLSNDNKIDESFSSQKVLKQLENSLVFIKSLIGILIFVSPTSKNELYSKSAIDAIEKLGKLGYTITTISSLEYAKSIKSADQKSNSILTRINILRNEILSVNEEDKENRVSFDAIISSLSVALKFSVSDDITVSKYCEYRKILTKKSKNVA